MISDVFSFLNDLPAFWGMMGAFIYASQKWQACYASCRETGKSVWPCTIDGLISLAVGAAAAAAFGEVVLTTLAWKDENAACATIGLFANTLAPEITKRGGQLVDRLLGAVMTSKGEDS